MTYQAALSTPEVEEVSFVKKINDAILGLVNCLTVRLVVTFLVGYAIVTLAADVIYPMAIDGMANQLVVRLADGIRKKAPTSHQILQTINRYNLSWYYITGSGGKVTPSTAAYAPDLSKYDISPRSLDWRGRRYYEAVSVLGNNQILHIGLYAGSILGADLGADAFLTPRGLGYELTVLLSLLVVTWVALMMWVSKPLNHLTRACYSLLLAREAYSHLTGGGLNVPGAVTEVQRVGLGLREIRRQYDEANAARASKEEEIKRQRSEHREEKEFISKQYQEEIAAKEAKLTELHTKEAEEEFINALSKEIDHFKSSQQIYHRVLEKLNDKYPTSIIFGAFFKIGKAMETSLESYLGFDERSIQALKKIEHGPIARKIMNSGQNLTIGPSAMRDFGFQQLAQNNSIRSIVYMPVKFQNRNLGMLAFYFVQEGQTVQERLRVLRNVLDLTARTLYQVVLFEEETEAARTDPMTGLRNKKFFYEIMPQVMEAASVKPRENPVSVIMIDGDHFKSINDTYGHQVGDQMLQQLAKTIKQCVRTNDSLSRSSEPGDYVIRFGGEEFLVVMEMTAPERAMSVAERIRKAVEEKSDWPGGIAKWTISLGVATYPFDGRNAEELLSKADNALYYVKEELGRNKTCNAEGVPKSYKAKSSAAAIGGELGVFDAAGLLQSISTSQKTGVLTVQSRDGKQLWLLFEAGKPVQARMGKLAGNAAITEFLVTFEEGSFNFQERSQSARDTKLPMLDVSFNVTRSLERCLMDGALATDNYNASRTVVPTSEIYIRPVPKEEFEARWAALSQLKEDDQPSPDEFAAMQEVVKRANGKSSLTAIFKSVDGMPTAHMWRAAALLVQYSLVETKPV